MHINSFINDNSKQNFIVRLEGLFRTNTVLHIHDTTQEINSFFLSDDVTALRSALFLGSPMALS